MERREISSSMMRSIGHDAVNSVLEIEFLNGQVWQYMNFPESTWYDFDGAESHGKYFNSHIKGSFPENRVG